MAWRDELRPASFRGVAFHVAKAPTEQRLHADEHVFAGRESAVDAIRVAHLGVGPQRYSIDAYVAGEDYMERRDALEEALREQSPGRLVHPYRGERTVSVVGSIQSLESPDAGGFCTIRFTVVVVSDGGLVSQVDTAALADRDLDAFLEEQAAAFGEDYDTESVTALYQVESRDYMAEAVAAVERVHREIAAVTETAENYRNRVEAFADDLEAAITAPAAAAQAIMGAVQEIAKLPGEARASLRARLDRVMRAGTETIDAFRALTDFSPDQAYVAPTTPGAIAQVRLREVVIRHARTAGVIGVSRAILNVPFASRTSALAARDSIAELYGGLVDDGEGAGGLTIRGARLFEALERARISVSRHLEESAAELPDVRTYTVPAAQPALVTAHTLYGDATRETELVIRNRPPDPSDIPGGTELEVLRT